MTKQVKSQSSVIFRPQRTVGGQAIPRRWGSGQTSKLRNEVKEGEKGGEAIELDSLHWFDDDRLQAQCISQRKNKKYEKINKASAKSRQS